MAKVILQKEAEEIKKDFLNQTKEYFADYFSSYLKDIITALNELRRKYEVLSPLVNFQGQYNPQKSLQQIEKKLVQPLEFKTSVSLNPELSSEITQKKQRKISIFDDSDYPHQHVR